MHRFLTASVKPAVLLGSALAVGLLMPVSIEAVSVTTTQLQMYADKSQASVNGSDINLDEPPAIINGQFFVPAKWLADTLNISLEWDSREHKIRLTAPKAFIQFDAPGNVIQVNGDKIPFDSVAEIRNGRLMVQLSWLARYADLPYQYKPETKGVVLNYTGQPSGPYKESLLRKDDAQMNSRPAALFAFGKPAYRLGEPVEYIDLSYDPDAEGLPDYNWTGKQEAFFRPGTYTVTLQVSDPHGNRSEPFSKSVTVLNEPYVSEQDYPVYFKPAGSVVEAKQSWLKGLQPYSAAKLPVVVRQPEDRTLIHGSSPVPIAAKGFLYQDSIARQGRLSIQYTNGLDQPVQFAVVIRNESLTKPVHVKTTRKAEAQASVYTPLLAHKTAEQFLGGSRADDEIAIEPGAAVFYKISPETAPGQGVHGLYDIETDGSVTVSYVMMDPGEKLNNLGSYRISGQDGARNGSYPVSEVSWQIDARELKASTAVGIGDSTVEPQLKGTDALKKLPSAVPGHSDVRYRVQVEVNGKTTIALHPRGGFFQGAIRVNGNLIALPAGGVTSNELFILHRTGAGKNKADIELMASDGSRVPVDLVLVPLFTGSK